MPLTSEIPGLALFLTVLLVLGVLSLPVVAFVANRERKRALAAAIRARGPIRNIPFPVGDPGVHHNIGPFVVGFEGDEKVIIPLRCYVPPGESCEHGVSAPEMELPQTR